MNQHVPYFDMDEFSTDPTSIQSGYKNTQEDQIMELVWHNGQPEVQNQSQRVFRKSSPPFNSQEEPLLNQPPLQPMAAPPPSETAAATQLFIQENEMTTWLHYPLDDDTSFDRNLTDLLYHPPGPSAAPPPSSVAPSRAISPAELRPPPSLAQHPHHPVLQTRHQSRPPAPAAAVGVNFPHFARLRPRFPEAGQSASSRNNELRESTVVDSNDTPKSSFLPESNSVVKISCGGSQGDETVGGSRSIQGTSTAGCSRDYTTMIRDSDTYNLTLTSFGGSFSGASATATADLITQPPADDRKRKGMEPAAAVYTENQSEDLEIESPEAMKQYPGTASGKRSRATEVHNLSERKRRDRINEKMKALQDLIPRCTKRNQTDKASMLDEAIDYLKSLQLQVQMMSVGYYGMVPMMFPGVQQFMPVPPIGVGTGMETGMSRPPMVPFPGAPSALGPRFTFPSFPTSPIPAFDPSTVQRNQMELAANPHGAPVANFVTMPTSADLYQQYLASLQMPGVSENQSASTVDTGKPSTSKEAER